MIVCRSYVQILLLMVLLAGCSDGGKTELVVAPAESAGETGAASRLVAGQPFVGTVTASYVDGTGLLTHEVTHTISHRKIKREVTQRTFVEKTLRLENVAGVVCDLDTEEVVLYREDIGGAFCVRLTLAEYRQHLQRSGFGSPGAIDFGYSTWFSLLSPVAPEHVSHSPETVELGGLSCELLTIAQPDVVMEIAHSRELVVDRELVELVELGLPAVVTGFPCRVRLQQKLVVPAVPVGPTASPARKWLAKGRDLAVGTVEKLLEAACTLIKVEVREVATGEFGVSDNFEELGSLPEFDARLHLHDDRDD